MSVVMNIPSENSDTPSSPAPETSKIIKRFKKRYPILFSIVVIIAFVIGICLSGSITEILNMVFGNK